MSVDVATLPASRDEAVPMHEGSLPAEPSSAELLASLLAKLVVEFDPMLADDVREHLEARAAEWDRDREASEARAELAARYRALAESIELVRPMWSCLGS